MTFIYLNILDSYFKTYMPKRYKYFWEKRYELIKTPPLCLQIIIIYTFAIECIEYSLSFHTIYSYPIKMIQEQLYTVVNMVIKIRIISWKSLRTDKKYSDKENENKAFRCWAIFTQLNNNEIGHSISMNGSSNLRAM